MEKSKRLNRFFLESFYVSQRINSFHWNGSEIWQNKNGDDNRQLELWTDACIYVDDKSFGNKIKLLIRMVYSPTIFKRNAIDIFGSVFTTFVDKMLYRIYCYIKKRLLCYIKPTLAFVNTRITCLRKFYLQCPIFWIFGSYHLWMEIENIKMESHIGSFWRK